MGRQLHRRSLKVRSIEPSCHGVVREEIVWFLTEAESATALHSNHQSLAEMAVSGRKGTRTDPADCSADDRMNAVCAASTIARHLRAIPKRDLAVLVAAFEPREWPALLEFELGRLTGIVVCLALGGGNGQMAVNASPAQEDEAARSLDAALRREGMAAVQGLRVEAHALFTRARRAYVKVRGLGPSVVPEGT
jgi:hypothetical protein